MAEGFTQQTKDFMHRLLISVLALLLPQVALATSAATEFGIDKLPIEPLLTLNLEPELCNKALQQMKTLFNSATDDMDIENEFFKTTPALRWQPLQTDQSETSAASLYSLNLDLNSDGKQQVIVHRILTHSWRGYWHYAYVFTDVNHFNQLKPDIIRAWSQPTQNQYSTENPFSAIGYFPSYKEADQDKLAGNVWAPNTLFKYNNLHYFFQATSYLDRRQYEGITIFRLHGNGQVEPKCTLSLPRQADQYKKFIATQGIASFIGTIRRIGAGGPDIGTGHYALQHDSASTAAEQRAAYRPWAIAEVRYKVATNTRALPFLESWSYQSLLNRREYQTLLEHMSGAEYGETKYLMDEFGLQRNTAEKNSALVINQLLEARVMVPSGFPYPTSSLIGFDLSDLSKYFLNRDRQALDGLADVSEFQINNQTKVSKNNLLKLAIEWPYGLNKLLAAGANPNTPDEIGKTPLMLAAHLNRPDAALTLLKAGANSNAKTKSATGFAQEGIINHRTALTYAAENANPLVMKILIDAGADIDTKDSKGNNISSYLAKNPRLTESEKKLSIAILAEQFEAFSKPSFNCSKAIHPLEKAICSDQVLAMYDNELNRAYLTAKDRFGAPLISEQKAWLVRRKSSCADDAALLDCLTEMTRTRVRYLHNRIVE